MAKQEVDPSLLTESPRSQTENEAGGLSWEKSTEERFEQLMNTGAIANTFYMNKDKMIKHAVKTIKEFCEEDPMRACELAIKGRNEYYMRTLPVVAVSQLSTIQSNEGKEAFQKAFQGVIKTARDLDDFIEITMGFRGLGRKLKREINRYIKGIVNDDRTNEFYAMKYRKHLEKAVKLAHPKSESKVEDDMITYIKGNPIDFEPYDQLKAYETFKGEEDLTPEEYVDLIQKHRLEMQTVIGIRKPTNEIWEALGPIMSTYQLTKNIATLERHIGGDKTARIVKDKLSLEALKKGKVLPFRVLQAYDKSYDPHVKAHLEKVANEYPKEYDFSSLGRVCIAPDISASMNGEIAQDVCTICKKPRGWGYKSCQCTKQPYVRSVVPSKIAGMLAGVLKVGIPDALLIPWGSHATTYTGNTDSVIKISETISRANGCSTNMEAPVEWLLQYNEKIDTLILITDSEEWGSGWLASWKKYLAQINPEARVILIRVDPYPTNPFPPEAALKYNVTQVYGWSDAVFKIIVKP